MLCGGRSTEKQSRERGLEKGSRQVDRSRKQHLYEIYSLQMQMVERDGEEEKRESVLLEPCR